MYTTIKNIKELSLLCPWSLSDSMTSVITSLTPGAGLNYWLNLNIEDVIIVLLYASIIANFFCHTEFFW